MPMRLEVNGNLVHFVLADEPNLEWDRIEWDATVSAAMDLARDIIETCVSADKDASTRWFADK